LRLEASREKARADHLAAAVVQHLVPATQEGTFVPAAEVLIATPSVRNLLREEKTHLLYQSMQVGARVGMQTLEISLWELVRYGMIQSDQALRQAQQSSELRRLLAMV